LNQSDMLVYCSGRWTAVPGAVHLGGVLLSHSSRNDLLQRMSRPARLDVGSQLDVQVIGSRSNVGQSTGVGEWIGF